jgi:hypothetical protein
MNWEQMRLQHASTEQFRSKNRNETMTTIIAQTIAADLVGGVTVILWVICGLFMAVVWILSPFIVCARLDRIIKLLSTPQGKETKEQ